MCPVPTRLPKPSYTLPQALPPPHPTPAWLLLRRYPVPHQGPSAERPWVGERRREDHPQGLFRTGWHLCPLLPVLWPPGCDWDRSRASWPWVRGGLLEITCTASAHAAFGTHHTTSKWPPSLRRRGRHAPTAYAPASPGTTHQAPGSCFPSTPPPPSEEFFSSVSCAPAPKNVQNAVTLTLSLALPTSL